MTIITCLCYNVPMDHFADIYGNDAAKELLRCEAERGTLSHAYIIEGEEGSGRKSLVRATLCTLAGEEQADKISRDISPDIIFVRPPEGKVQIVVDQIRAIRGEAYYAPNELSFKAFIIEDAHRMNEAAQNALLKLLEEPPAGVYFFLLCETGNKLLPTVSSRAQTLRTQVFAEGELDEILCTLSPRASLMKRQKEDEYAYLLKASGGSIGRALSLLAGEEKLNTALYTTVCGALDVLRGSDKGALVRYEGSIPDDREGFGEFLFSLCSAFRDILVLKKGGEQLLFFKGAADAEEYSFAFSEAVLAKNIHICLKHTEQNEFSVNLRLARLRLLDELWG